MWQKRFVQQTTTRDRLLVALLHHEIQLYGPKRPFLGHEQDVVVLALQNYFVCACVQDS
jgi:hypothetical protein